MWDAVEALLNDARAIQHDRQWVMRQQLGPACCRLVWLSMAELAGGLAGCSALTPIQRRCLLGQLHFLPELRLAALVAEQPGGGDDGDSGCIQHPEPGNEAGLPNEGLGSTPLTEDPDVLALACGYSVETVVYLDALANLFGLVPTRASIQNLSANQGNAYLDMPASDKRQARLLFRMASCSDASADQLDSGLQLVIRLLEVLPNAHARLDASNQQAEEESTTLVSDIGLCLVAADRAAARTPDADGRVSGLADLIPLQAVLSCARAVSDRSCQYAAVACCAAFAAWPQPAPPPAAAASLTSWSAAGFSAGQIGTARNCGADWWGSVLPAICRPTRTMSPSRRPEVFAQLFESVGTGAHLWALLLLLNRRARLLQQQRRKRRQPPSQQQRLSESEDGDADGQFERRPATPTVNLGVDLGGPAGAAAQQQQPQQFDSLGSSVLAEFAVSEQLLACAGLIRYLCDKAADEFGGDEYFRLRRAGRRARVRAAARHSGRRRAAGPAGVRPLNFVGAHLSRRDLLAGMAEAENSAAAMTQLFEALVNALLWATGPSNSSRAAIWPACAFEPSSGEQAVPGVSIPAGRLRPAARPEPAVRRKALDLMLSKLTGLDRAGAVPLLRQSLLDCLAGVERNYQGSQVALILRSRAGSSPAGRLRAEAGAELLFGHRRLQFLPAATTAADIYADSNSGSSSSSSSWESFGCALLRVRRVSQAARHRGFCRWLPGSCRSFCRDCDRPWLISDRPAWCCWRPSPFLQAMHRHYAADSQLRPKLRSVLSSVARGVHPAQLLPALQDCLKPHQQQQPWLRAEHWARLLRLNLEMTVASEAANRLEEDDSDSADAAGSLADFEAELSDLFSSLLGSVFGSGEEDADGDSGTMMMAARAAGRSLRKRGEGGAEDQAKGRLVAQLAACLAPLPPATRAMLLQSLQDWAAGSASREAAFHRLMAVALASQSGRVSGLAGLLCELDAPQHAAALLELPGADSQQPRPSRQLSRWLLACLAALFKAAGGSSGLGLDLLDSIGSLLVD
uniref:MYND-type domain-containing protein n=1 Tax=Macrostomum lignano TaxID=282301 RepID=A0A1I8I223_9PLAT